MRAYELMVIIDGLLLSGGPDIDPVRYGDSYVHPATYGIDPDRDQFEIDLFKFEVLILHPEVIVSSSEGECRHRNRTHFNH